MDKMPHVIPFPKQNVIHNHVLDTKNIVLDGVSHLLKFKNKREFELTYEVAELVQEWGYDKHDDLVSEILSVWGNREKRRIQIVIHHETYPAPFALHLDGTQKYDLFRDSLYDVAAYFYSYPKDTISVQMVGGNEYKREGI